MEFQIRNRLQSLPTDQGRAHSLFSSFTAIFFQRPKGTQGTGIRPAKRKRTIKARADGASRYSAPRTQDLTDAVSPAED
jgi:hypothetical protein